MLRDRDGNACFVRRAEEGRAARILTPWACLLGFLALACGASGRAGGEGVGGSGEKSSDADCRADPAWISSPSEPDAEAFEADSNCSFHQWAYQTFLWLTSPREGSGRLVLEGLANPIELFRPGGPGAPYPGRAADEAPRLLARTAKSRATADIEDVFQAGPGNRILVDQNGEVVYYSNHLNEVYWDFVVEHELYDLGRLQSFPAETDFPVGALELKASWRIAVKDGQTLIEGAAERFHLIEAEVPTVGVNEKGIVVEDKSRPIAATMALVGLHVTGVVKGHPEFIWATFEHVDNAPVYASTPTSDPGPSGPWSFYAPGTPRNQTNQFDQNDPLAVVNVCLVHEHGGGSKANQTAIETLNASVRALQGDSLWSHYFLGGAVWTNGDVPLNNGAFAPGSEDATQLGSLDLANTTLETFTQNDNCFACHNAGAHEVVVGDRATEVGAKHVNLSHFIVNYQAVQQVKAGR